MYEVPLPKLHSDVIGPNLAEHQGETLERQWRYLVIEDGVNTRSSVYRGPHYQTSG